MATLLNPFLRALDLNADPISGGFLYVFEAGTTTPALTYSDSVGGTPHTHPIEADAAGNFPQAFIEAGSYKIRIADSSNVTLDEVDFVFIPGSSNQPVFLADRAAIMADDTTYVVETVVYGLKDNTKFEIAASGASDFTDTRTDGQKLYDLNGRNARAASYGASLPDGTAFAMNGVMYKSESSFTGTDSCTSDLGQDGVVPFGVFTPQHFGAAGDGTTDDTAAIQRAVTNAANGGPQQSAVYFPSGTYLVSGGISENTNGGGLNLYGDGKRKSIIQLAAGVTNTNVFDIGTTTGHGAYYLYMHDLTILGTSRNDGNIAIYCPEGGISRVRDLDIRDFADAIHGIAWTGVVIDGLCEIYRCTRGIYLPQGGGNNSPTNTAVIRNVWFEDCDQCVFVDGGGNEISNCVSQDCGLTGSAYLFHMFDSAESASGAQFAGGKIFNNWAEGGTYKYTIFVEGVRGVSVYDNHCIGALAGTGLIEGGILIEAPLAVVTRNTAYQYFEKSVADGRVQNAAIYIGTNSILVNGRDWNVYDNMLTRTQAGNIYYFEGEPNPTVSRETSRSAFAYVTISEGVATVQSGKNVRSVTQAGGGTGQYNVLLEYARDSLQTPVFVQPSTEGAATPIHCVVVQASTQTISLRFYDTSGTLVDPPSFSIEAKGANARY